MKVSIDVLGGSGAIAIHIQPVPLGVTFSNAVSKIKARRSLSTETWQKRRSSFEL